MGPLNIDLRASTIPQNDDPLEIHKDAIFCSSCMNLYAASANAMVLAGGVFTDDGEQLPRIKAAEDDGELVEAIPTWAGVTRADYAPYEVETYLTDILAAAKRGCETCAMLQAVISRLDSGAVSFTDPLQAATIRFCRGSTVKVIISRVEKDVSGSDTDSDFFFPLDGGREQIGSLMVEEMASFELYALPLQRTPWFSIGSLVTDDRPRSPSGGFSGGRARHVFTDPNTQPCFDLAREWLDTCMKTHEACRLARLPLPLPKRVIHVGDQNNTTIRLMENNNASIRTDSGKPPSYLALSHCWGSKVPLTTEKVTLDQRKTNIAWDSLPRTFQDAVTITRELGFDYVWIDSLCIVQDDTQDWVTEAAKMASIYEGATLVLAATASVDGRGGCLFTRDKYIEIQGKSHDGVPYSFFARKAVPHLIFNSDLNVKRLEEGPTDLTARPYPLFKRAWCFQERLLATRMLHFTKGEMVFECLSEINCECGRLRRFTSDTLRRSKQAAKLGTPVGSDFFNWMTSTDRLSNVTPKDRGAADSFQTWRQLVLLYSKKDITRHSDRLPAISGLASIWPGKDKGRYLAGIWSGDVLKSLLWTANMPNLDHETEYIAPSWSWASSRRGVNWTKTEGESIKFHITVDEDQSGCEAATTDPLGAVKSGWLSIRGRVVAARVESLNETGGFVKSPRNYGTAFTCDDLGSCKPLLGEDIICLRLCAFARSTIDTALVLARPPAEYVDRLPWFVRGHQNIFRRVGITKFYNGKEWHHDTDSEELDMYVV